MDYFDWLEEEFFGRPFPETMVERPKYRKPVVDVWETDSEVILTAELPGIEEQNIDLIVEENKVIIKAFRKDVTHKLPSPSNYYRVVWLPARVDPENYTKTFKHGVLELRLKKRSMKRLEVR
jgi:HSP20 family protein